MSQFFQAGGEVLWNPGSRVAQLFLGTAGVLSAHVEMPTGLGPMESDECEVDLPVFAAFVGALADRHDRSNHTVERALIEGFVATALVLVERGGTGDLPAGSGGWAAAQRTLARRMPR